MIGSGRLGVAGVWGRIGVSILVVLDDWFGLEPCSTRRKPSDWVSILVVLDDWFGQLLPTPNVDPRNVSILVVLDDWFGQRFGEIFNAAIGFQSLLFWMIGSGLPFIHSCTSIRCFNPCCFG